MFFREEPRLKMVIKWTWLALSCLTFAVCAVVLINMSRATARLRSPTVLYTAPHAEFATFQRVWNPDSNSDYSLKDFSKESDDDSDADQDVAFLCGEDGSKCPEVPAFGGEDYFDQKPIGLHLLAFCSSPKITFIFSFLFVNVLVRCCYNKEQQKVWTKWLALKNRVGKLEGILKHLMKKRTSVDVKWKV